MELRRTVHLFLVCIYLIQFPTRVKTQDPPGVGSQDAPPASPAVSQAAPPSTAPMLVSSQGAAAPANLANPTAPPMSTVSQTQMTTHSNPAFSFPESPSRTTSFNSTSSSGQGQSAALRNPPSWQNPYDNRFNPPPPFPFPFPQFPRIPEQQPQRYTIRFIPLGSLLLRAFTGFTAQFLDSSGSEHGQY